MKCKICGSSTISFFDNQLNILFFSCKKCGFIFKNPSSYISRKEELKQYNLHENTLNNTGYVNNFKKFINYSIEPFLPDINSLLDFGCGPNPVLIKLLKNKILKLDFYDPFFYSNPIETTYDMITATEVFEHLKNPLKTVEEIDSYLNKGGFIAIQTFFRPKTLISFKKWWYRRDPTHVSFYSQKSIVKLFKYYHYKPIRSNNKNYIVLKKDK
ncbi:MAG TPA: class I SAM-dependent methyltransferase [Candidatus Mcinerneyibacterium sp.]|nr:class I SAM-dependent methyltransferase [Candidatus Mcinerneyibacterium sp.]